MKKAKTQSFMLRRLVKHLQITNARDIVPYAGGPVVRASVRQSIQDPLGGVYETKNMNVHFSSKTPEWETPQGVFDVLNEEFKLKVDVCATGENAKLSSFFTKDDDGLSKNWRGLRCWMNPPYGREIGKWIEKAATGGASIVVALLPARTDTRWFKNYCAKAEVRFISGRLKFGGHKNSAPFPSMVVIFGTNRATMGMYEQR